ncbi:DUF402 domain-containing protein [Macrococcus equipercicus]|uniref:DUF402 domain-containing protein n=1 Tax=Macrococcus equipercicus TaxID=69967 RepID=A0A9Q9BR33_9STAP|nr:DUF402 domain-containing protein [Macrococcus equipercicus]KAA1037618.1 DUF402 domain-containing protein [Macrococcus equipercicus]UTH14131.1 DUF402 domain-containing protein [Macrococcus equipercicus]
MEDTILIKSYKYPNNPHVEYKGKLLDETSHYWLVYCPKFNELKHFINEQTYISEHASLHFFSKYHGYTVSICIDDDMKPLSMFCNISTPCKNENGNITYIDIDMDYVKTSEGLWFLKNHEMYLKNSRKYHYPIQLTNFAVVSLQELKNNITNGVFPFGVQQFDTVKHLIAK